MLKKIAVFGVLSIFGYTVFKQVFIWDSSIQYDGDVDTDKHLYEVNLDE